MMNTAAVGRRTQHEMTDGSNESFFRGMPFIVTKDDEHAPPPQDSPAATSSVGTEQDPCNVDFPLPFARPQPSLMTWTMLEARAAPNSSSSPPSETPLDGRLLDLFQPCSTPHQHQEQLRKFCPAPSQDDDNNGNGPSSRCLDVATPSASPSSSSSAAFNSSRNLLLCRSVSTDDAVTVADNQTTMSSTRPCLRTFSLSAADEVQSGTEDDDDDEDSDCDVNFSAGAASSSSVTITRRQAARSQTRSGSVVGEFRFLTYYVLLYTPDHLLLNSAPNLGALISRWKIIKFENC